MRRAASAPWREFVESDPLYALLGEVQEDRVVGPDGKVREVPLNRYLHTLLVRKAAKKPKDWVEVWASMTIPIDSQAAVLTQIINFGMKHAPAGFGKILGELIKGHRVKTKAVEDSVHGGALKGAIDRHGVLREMLYIIYPKGPSSEWGWSRVGWGWQEWWKILDHTLTALDATSAFNELATLLDRIEAEGGIPLAQQQIWNEKRLGTARTLLCKLGEVEDEADLLACLDATLK